VAALEEARQRQAAAAATAAATSTSKKSKKGQLQQQRQQQQQQQHQQLQAPPIELVLLKGSTAFNHDTVLAHSNLSYATPIRLEGVKTDNLVVIRLGAQSGYLSIEGTTLKSKAVAAAAEAAKALTLTSHLDKRTSDVAHPSSPTSSTSTSSSTSTLSSLPPSPSSLPPSPSSFKVASSSSDGFAWVRVVPSLAPSLPWYRTNEMVQAGLLGLYACYSMNFFSVLVLGYIAWCVFQVRLALRSSLLPTITSILISSHHPSLPLRRHGNAPFKPLALSI